MCRKIAEHFTAERLAPFPNVDVVVAFTHNTGCGIVDTEPHFDRLPPHAGGLCGMPTWRQC